MNNCWWGCTFPYTGSVLHELLAMRRGPSSFARRESWVSWITWKPWSTVQPCGLLPALSVTSSPPWPARTPAWEWRRSEPTAESCCGLHCRTVAESPRCLWHSLETVWTENNCNNVFSLGHITATFNIQINEWINEKGKEKETAFVYMQTERKKGENCCCFFVLFCFSLSLLLLGRRGLGDR